MPRPGISTSVVSQITGVDPATLDCWDKHGIVSPSIKLDGQETANQQHQQEEERRWSVADLIAVAAVAALADTIQGDNPEQGRLLARTIQEQGRSFASGKERWPEFVVLAGEGVFLCNGKQVPEQIGSVKMALVLRLGQLARSVIACLKKIQDKELQQGRIAAGERRTAAGEGRTA